MSHLTDMITATELILPYEIRSPWFPHGSLQYQETTTKILRPFSFGIKCSVTDYGSAICAVTFSIWDDWFDLQSSITWGYFPHKLVSTLSMDSATHVASLYQSLVIDYGSAIYGVCLRWLIWYESSNKNPSSKFDCTLYPILTHQYCMLQCWHYITFGRLHQMATDKFPDGRVCTVFGQLVVA